MRVVDDRLYKWDAPLLERLVLLGVQPDHDTLLAVARRELAADDGVKQRLHASNKSPNRKFARPITYLYFLLHVTMAYNFTDISM